MNVLKSPLILAVIALLGGAGFIYSGAYNIGADAPHWPITFKLIEILRDRSIAVRVKGIEEPPLDDSALIAKGAGDYSAMCTGCHLAPGMGEDTKIRAGLYPQPPNLSEPSDLSPAEAFWIIKHGIKMSSMPAWGASLDDHAIWGLVAFLRKMPSLTPEQYAEMTANAGGHDVRGETDSMPGMDMKSENGGTDAMPGMEVGSKKGSAGADTPEAAVEGFLKALAAGDEKAAKQWLAPDVLIYESGSKESSRDKYAAHHMKADMAFLAKAKMERLERATSASSSAAWVTSRLRIQGQSQGKPVDLLSTETMILTREDEGWRIRHIHWSSRKANAEAE